MTASFGFAFVLLIFASPIMFILYGDEFLQMSPQLSLLGWCLLPYTISSFLAYDLIVKGFENIVAKSAVFSLLIYLSLYLLLIPVYGITGAVWAALIGEVFQSIVFIIFYTQNTNKAVMAYFYEPE
jgi:O-antigen/teichoic acid export membrane protein